MVSDLLDRRQIGRCVGVHDGGSHRCQWLEAVVVLEDELRERDEAILGLEKDSEDHRGRTGRLETQEVLLDNLPFFIGQHL